MGQRICIVLTFLLAAMLPACDKPGEVPQSSQRDGIVSISPAASDLLVQLGLLDRIVGVSAYEAHPQLKSLLPVVGDYERIDWEKMAQLRPRYLVVQGQPQRLPEGLKERCEAAGVELINIQIDRLDDIPLAVVAIAEALGIKDAGDATAKKMREEIVARLGQTPALIVLSENGKFVAGRDTFLDDLLARAGGANVITANGYPTIDQEMLLTLRPQVIFILLPDASDATAAEARASIDKAKSLPAVEAGRVYVIRRADVLLPSHSNAVALLKELAERMPRGPM